MKKIWGIAALLLFLNSAAAEVHDIEVAADYSQSVGGIRLSYGNVSIMDEAANLSVGRIYEIRYKIKNLGDFSEKANITVNVVNQTYMWNINTRSRTVAAKKSLYLAEEWDTRQMPEGSYWITVEAKVLDDANASNDNRTRNITLHGRAAETTTTTTSRTSTTAASTSSSTTPGTSTTAAETSSSTSRTTSAASSTSSSTSTTPRASTSAARQSSSTTIAEAGNTAARASSSTTSGTGASSSSSTFSSSASSTIIAVSGNVVSASSEGRQTVVVFLVLVAGAVLYLSKK